jgi:hypothetical protein
MNQPSHHQIATYLTDYALSELVKYVMEDTGCSIEQAMEKVYNSPLMDILQDEDGELYVQSPAYLYELMNIQVASKFKDIWFGCLHVKTRSRNNELLGDVEGAYVQTIAKVHNKEEFVSLLKECTLSFDLEFVELEDISTLQYRLWNQLPVAEILLEESKSIHDYGHVRFSTFHTY